MYDFCSSIGMLCMDNMINLSPPGRPTLSCLPQSMLAACFALPSNVAKYFKCGSVCFLVYVACFEEVHLWLFFLLLRCKSCTSCCWVRVNDKSRSRDCCSSLTSVQGSVFPRSNGNGQMKRNSITKSQPQNGRNWTIEQSFSRSREKPHTDRAKGSRSINFAGWLTKLIHRKSGASEIRSRKSKRQLLLKLTFHRLDSKGLNSTRSVECKNFRIVCWWVFKHSFVSFYGFLFISLCAVVRRMCSTVFV